MNFARTIMVSLLALFALSTIVNADLAQPMAFVNVTYDGGPIVGNFTSMALVCYNSTTLSSLNLTQPNVTYYDNARGCYWVGFYNQYWRTAHCSSSECTFINFPFEDTKLYFYLPSLNRSFITNAISHSAYSTNFNAQLFSNGTAILTKANGNNGNDNLFNVAMGIGSILIFELLLTLLIEVPVAFLYLRFRGVKNKRRLLLITILVNIISQPIVLLVFVMLFPLLWGIVIGEIFAVLFEGYLIHYLNKKVITLKDALLMSFLMNLASVIIGTLLLFSAVA
ncbi:MAG: hypothetical protein ABSD68_02545 [Candidatus Micrarchaeales archaeon]|jgi:hypothetical protein